MTDHHDFGDHHDDFPVFEEPHVAHDQELDTPALEDHHYFDTAEEHPWHEPAPAEEHHDTFDEPAPADDHAVSAADDVAAPQVDVFPPALDVGALPEPVDGFPWIDTGSLGVVHAATDGTTTDPVRPEELAEYAGVDLPEAQDPWAALADAEDPATSTLARWWSEN